MRQRMLLSIHLRGSLCAGAQVLLSPDQTRLSVLEPQQQAVSVVHLTGPHALSVFRFSASALVAGGAGEVGVREVFSAMAWSPDSQHVLLAGITGSLYLITR